ncbi:MAG: hypothetical protein HY361_04835 [Candidatus Aenigmarchaeota archaeon]|nr:hypothetical protein [Candidatus Aenigmarchaeota archaeon]
MRGLVIYSILLVVIVSISFAAENINNGNVKPKGQSKELTFSTFTSAVCENKGELVHCKDEFFVNCNGSISKATDVAECNGMKVDVPKALGFATFGNDWKDPRV